MGGLGCWPVGIACLSPFETATRGFCTASIAVMHQSAFRVVPLIDGAASIVGLILRAHATLMLSITRTLCLVLNRLPILMVLIVVLGIVAHEITLLDRRLSPAWKTPEATSSSCCPGSAPDKKHTWQKALFPHAWLRPEVLPSKLTAKIRIREFTDEGVDPTTYD